MVSALDPAKRALVALLRTLAAAYACSVKVTRDSADAEVHPDRPTGSAADQKRLNAAHDKWQALLKAAPGSGRKRGAGSPTSAPPAASAQAYEAMAHPL